MTIDTSGEAWRHQCEVRWVLTRNSTAWLEAYAAGVSKIRGKASAKRLWDDVGAQYKAGNRGAAGDWRDVQQQRKAA